MINEKKFIDKTIEDLIKQKYSKPQVTCDIKNIHNINTPDLLVI